MLRMLSDFLTEPVVLQGLKVRDLSFIDLTNVHTVVVLILHPKTPETVKHTWSRFQLFVL